MGASVVLRLHPSRWGELPFTAAPRDLYRAYPNLFDIGIQTSRDHMNVWANNPFVTWIFDYDYVLPPEYTVVDVVAPPGEVDGKHVLQAHNDVVAAAMAGLGVTTIPLTELRPYITATGIDRLEVPNHGLPFWLVWAGGPADWQTIWWDVERNWSWVTAILAPRNDFPDMAQLGTWGEYGAYNPQVKWVINMIKYTNYQEMVWLASHANGIMCPPLDLMHIAAAFNKPCVVPAGASVSWQWLAYDQRAIDLYLPTIPPQYHSLFNGYVPHIYLDTIGLLPCSLVHGCGRQFIFDGSNPCVFPSQPDRYAGESVMSSKCMKLIDPRYAAQAVLSYNSAHVPAIAFEWQAYEYGYIGPISPWYE